MDKGGEFFDNIYNISWYLLPISDQVSILILLGMAIEEKTMSAGLTVISLEQFVEVFKFYTSNILIIYLNCSSAMHHGHTIQS